MRGDTVGLVGESGCGKSTLRTPSCSSSSNRPPARCATRARSSTSDGIADLRRKAQIIFQDPFSSLNPRKTVRRAIEEVLAVHRLCPSECAEGAGGRVARAGRSLARARRPPSAPVQRRAAPAHRHRPRTRRRPGVHRRRRARVRSRRLCAGPGAEPPRRAAGAARPDLSVHLAQPRRRPPREPARRRHVPRQGGRGGADRRALREAAASVHAGADACRARSSTRTRSSRPPPSKETSRTRSIPRAAATSIRAARLRWMCAGRSIRRCTGVSPERVVACHLYDSQAADRVRGGRQRRKLSSRRRSGSPGRRRPRRWRR